MRSQNKMNSTKKQKTILDANIEQGQLSKIKRHTTNDRNKRTQQHDQHTPLTLMVLSKLALAKVLVSLGLILTIIT